MKLTRFRKGFLHLLGKDYWIYTDRYLLELAKKYGIADNSSLSFSESWFFRDSDKNFNPQLFRDKLATGEREKIINGLIKRDLFMFSNLTWGISLLGILISLIALLYP